MKTILLQRPPDRWETAASALMGLAAAVAVAAFLGALVRVSDRAPGIARVLERAGPQAVEALVASDATNAPSHSGRARHPGPVVRKVRLEGMRPSAPLRPGV